MMRNLIMTIALFSFLSCEKESGFIPEPDLNNPHYSEQKPELQWRSNIQLHVDLDDYRVIDDLMIVFGVRKNNLSKESIQAFHLANGDLAWELDVYDLLQGTHIQNFHVLKEGQTLYFIDLNYGRTFLINAGNGELIEFRTLNGVDTYQSFTAYVKDQFYYHLDYKGDGKTALYKYDIIEHEVEELIDLSEYTIRDEVSRAVYHESDNTLYIHANIDHRKNVILSLDLNTKEVYELWGRTGTSSLIYFPSEDLLLIEDMLIFESSREEIYAVNRISGDVEWILNKESRNPLDNIFSHMGNAYILIGDSHLIAIDHQSGDIKWRNNYANIYPNISLHPDENLLIGVNTTSDYKQKAAIYDLTNGQKMVEWNAAKNAEDEITSVRFATYHEETNSIYLATFDELMKYNWPLP